MSGTVALSERGSGKQKQRDWTERYRGQKSQKAKNCGIKRGKKGEVRRRWKKKGEDSSGNNLGSSLLTEAH